MKTIPAGTLVLVTWNDIQSHGDWNDDPESESSATLSTPGYLKRPVDKRYRDMKLCSTYSHDEDSLHDLTAIPTGCVVRVQALATGEELWDQSNKD